MNENITRLEEKIAYLERHVTEQDKAMLEFAEELAAVRRELRLLRERGAAGGPDGERLRADADERPPHY